MLSMVNSLPGSSGSIRSFIMLDLGAFTSPLVATQFTQLRHWSFHYIVSLGIATCNTLVLCLIFGTKTLDGGLIYLSLDSCEFTLLFKNVYILLVKKQQRRGKTSIAHLTRSFVSKLSIFSHSLSLCRGDHWWYGHSPFLISEADL